MSRDGKIDSTSDFTPKGLMSLKLWLDPWFRRVAGAVGGHVIQDEGVDLPQRGHLNFVGAGVTATDDPPDTTLITIPGTATALSETILGMSGLDAFWKMNELAGTVAADSSGNGFDMAGSGPSPVTAWGSDVGPPGETSAYFNGPINSDGFQNNAITVYSDDVTFLGWVKGELIVGGYGGPLHGGSARGWGIYISSDRIVHLWIANGGGTVTVDSDSTLGLTTYAMIAARRQSGTWKLFINGVAQTGSSILAPTMTGVGYFALGNDFFDTGFFGNLSYMALFGRALSDTEISNLNTVADTGGFFPGGIAGGVLDGTYPNPGLAAGVAGAGLAETSNVLSVNVDGSTLEINSDTLRVKDSGVTEAKIGLSDNTTDNVSTTKHGFAPKAPNDATKFLDGTGAYSVPTATPSGTAGGALAGTYPNPTLAAVIAAGGPIGSATTVPVITYNAAGQLTVVSSATITPAAGSGGALTLISDQTLLSAAATIDFTSIPATYTHLLVQLLARGDTAAATVDLYVRFNNDSGANYYWQAVRGITSAASANQALATTEGAFLFLGPAGTATAGFASTTILDIPFYAGTTFKKTTHARTTAKDSNTSGHQFVAELAGWWDNAAAINRVTLRTQAGNFDVGSRATLYGVS